MPYVNNPAENCDNHGDSRVVYFNRRHIRSISCLAAVALVLYSSSRCYSDTLSILTSDKLAELITGKILTYDHLSTDINSRQSGEFFSIDGKWFKKNDRTWLFGEYYIASDSLCIVILKNKTRCRKVFVNMNNDFFISDDASILNYTRIKLEKPKN